MIMLIDKGTLLNWLPMKYDLPMMIGGPENIKSFQVLHLIHTLEKNACVSVFLGNVH